MTDDTKHTIDHDPLEPTPDERRFGRRLWIAGSIMLVVMWWSSWHLLGPAGFDWYQLSLGIVTGAMIVAMMVDIFSPKPNGDLPRNWETVSDAERQRILTELQEFATTHPGFGELGEEIANLIKAGRTKNLQQAYDIAARLRPRSDGNP